MAIKVRGHYRIDAHGRIVPMADVNDPGVTYATPLPRIGRVAEIDRPQIIEWVVLVCIIAILLGLLAVVVPRVRQAAFAAQAAQAAAQRAALVQSLANKPPANPPPR